MEIENYGTIYSVLSCPFMFVKQMCVKDEYGELHALECCGKIHTQNKQMGGLGLLLLCGEAQENVSILFYFSIIWNLTVWFLNTLCTSF